MYCYCSAVYSVSLELMFKSMLCGGLHFLSLVSYSIFIVYSRSLAAAQCMLCIFYFSVQMIYCSFVPYRVPTHFFLLVYQELFDLHPIVVTKSFRVYFHAHCLKSYVFRFTIRVSNLLLVAFDFSIHVPLNSFSIMVSIGIWVLKATSDIFATSFYWDSMTI